MGYLIAGIMSCNNSGSDGKNSSRKSPPEFTVTLAPPITLANRDAYKIVGTCTVKDKRITVVVETLDPVNTPCGQDYRWQVEINVSVLSVDGGGPISMRAMEFDDRPIEFEVERDVTPPQVHISPNPLTISSINQENYRIAGTCDAVDGEVALDLEGIEAKATCDGDNWAAEGIDLSSLDATVIQVTVTADLKDKLGNPAQQATESFQRDVSPPDGITLTAPGAINIVTINSYSLGGGRCEDGTGAVTIKIAGLNDFTVDCADELWNLDVPSSELGKLPEQLGIALSVEHRDSVGNVATLSGRVDKDTVAPELNITSGLIINIANKESYNMEGECSENGREVSITLGGDLTSTATEDCSNNRWDYSPNLEEGRFSITLAQSDAAGNTTAFNSPTLLLKDVTAPVFSFDSDLDINAANENVWHISGTCSEDGTVTVTLGSLGSKSAICQDGRWRTAAFNTASIASTGTFQILASVVDLADNSYTIPGKTVDKDTSGWAVEISLPEEAAQATPINLGNVENYPVNGICSSQEGDVTVTVGGGSGHHHHLQ